MLNRYKQLPAIPKNTTPHSPGVCKIYFLPVERINEDPKIFNAAGEIVVIPATFSKFNTAELSSYSRDYNEVLKESDAGDYYEITITGFLPFESKLGNLNLETMRYHRYIMMVITPAGIIKWLGAKDNPVKMHRSYSSGKQGGGASAGTTLSWYWESETKPLELGISIPPAIIL